MCRVQLVYFVRESHEGSNLAEPTKEESMETSDMYFIAHLSRRFQASL